jgi:proteasome assembly chaperone 4
MSNEIAEIEYVDSSFKTHEFSFSFFTSDVKFEILKMKESTFIWIGDAHNCRIADLSFGIPTASNCHPVTTKILGIASSNTISEMMAERLTKKLKKPVYVSFNSEIQNMALLEKIQERLVEEIDLHSEFF